MDQQQNIKQEIRESALRLLQFTTQICNERKRPGLIAFFKDDIINLTQDAKMMCSLLRLYNTFRQFEPLVLVQLNEFLPLDLRYIVTERRVEASSRFVVDLPIALEEHSQSCPKSHEIPEEDEFDVYLVSLSELVDAETAAEFKQLLTKFVTGSNCDKSEQNDRTEREDRTERVEVLEFILRSAQLLGAFPELLGGLLEYLNKQWYEYAIQQLKFENLEQIALAYQVFSENAKPIDLFKSVVKQYKSGKLGQASLLWRERVIAEIQAEVRRVAGVSDSLMEQFKFEKKTLGTRELQPLQKPDQQGTLRQHSDPFDPMKRELKALIDVLSEPLAEPENPRPISEISSNLNDFYAEKRWREVNIAFGVPVHREALCELVEVLTKHESKNEDESEIELFPYAENFESSLLERAFLHQMEEYTSKNQLHLDDCEEFYRLRQFHMFCNLILKKRPNMTYMQFKFACIERLNEIQLQRLEQYREVYSCENMIHDSMFCNSEKVNCYNSTIYKPILPFDEKRSDLFYYECDIQPLEHFTQFEKNLYNMTLIQKAKYCQQLGIVTNNNETTNGYSFKHPVNIEQRNEHSCLNKDVYSAFANGYEAARANSANPYMIHELEIETDRVFHEYEEPAALEEHMMKYDIFLANLKLAAQKLAGYCRCACPRLYALVTRSFSEQADATDISSDAAPVVSGASGQSVPSILTPACASAASVDNVVAGELTAPLSAQEAQPYAASAPEAYTLSTQPSATPSEPTIEELRAALRQDMEEFEQPIELILPETCEILLKSTLGDDYFDQLFLYTRITAPYALRRVEALFCEVQKHRNLIISPTFSKRVKVCYFRSLDFAGKAFLESDKKILGSRIFLEELQIRKQTAGLLKIENLHLLDSSLKPVYPWDFEPYGLPLSYFNCGKTDVERLERAKCAFGLFRYPACHSLLHDFGGNSRDSADISAIPDDLRDFCNSFPVVAKLTAKPHFCYDMHSVMLPISQISADAFTLAREVLNSAQQPLMESILRAIQAPCCLWLETSIYVVFRLVLVLLDRLSFLLQIVNDGQHSINLRAEIDGSEPQQQQNTSYAQNQQRELIFAQIAQLTEPEVVQKPPKHLRGAELLAFLLTSGAPEESFFAAFGMRAYAALGFRGLVRQVKRLVDELADHAHNIQNIVAQQITGLALTPLNLAGFLLMHQFWKQTPLIGSATAESILRSVPTAQVFIYEEVQGWIGFSELEL